MFRNLALVSLAVFANAAVEAAEPQLEFDYGKSRQAFRDVANEIVSSQRYGSAEIGPRLEPLKVEYPGGQNDDLTMDALVIPATKKKSLVIQINSGAHGLETPTGSYMEQRFLSKCLPSLPKELLEETTFVVTHSLNPWGFKNGSRFNGNNVDLNRNCGGARVGGEFDVCEGGKPNKEYGAMKWLFDWLVQRDAPVSLTWCKIGVSAVAIYNGGFHAQSFGEKALRGQTDDPNGIYFAGRELQPECKLYEDFSRQFYQGEGAHRHSLTITWHTGYGSSGHLQLMGDSTDQDSKRLVSLLSDQVFTPGEMQHLDLDPSFKTCNDENVWLRHVEPDRQPQAGSGTNSYLTAEVGAEGDTASICAVLMGQQLTRNQGGTPLFKGDVAQELRKQAFTIFNPTDESIDTKGGSKTYLQLLDEHADYSCRAIERYMRAVIAEPTGQSDDGSSAAPR
ncbi:DUF2817 domain-containing protein [Methyloceanibacter sp.]|uniref:DUF2817 domain-containing protein n=1 Tax=Methyloceanibacter sp. TaxID=1965321 RepID=UPI003D6CB363